MTALTQHLLFDAALTLPDPSGRPYWMPARDLDEGWHIDSGEFPHVVDHALLAPEETP